MLVLSYPRVDYDTICDDDRAGVFGVALVVDAINVKPMDEQTLFKYAAQQAIFHTIGKVFQYDCEAVKDYINGDLTFKGLLKKIDPRKERDCR